MTSIILLGAATGTLTAQVATVVLAFTIVVWILYKYAWGPALSVIDERRETVIKEFESLEQRQADLDAKIDDYNQRLENIDQEARERTNKAIEEGKQTSEQILAEARRESEALKEKAKADIQMEIEKARVELRDDIVKLTIGATEKLLHQQLDQEQHGKLVNEFVEELQKQQAT